MSYPSEVLADSPHGYWRLNGAGSSWPDSSGLSHDGAGTPDSTGVAGAINDGDTAVTFGTNYVAVGDHADFDLGDTFTVEAWTKIGSYGTTKAVLSKGSGAYYLRLDSSGGHLFMYLIRSAVAGIALATTQYPEDGAWHHLVATKTGATVKLYQDAVDITPTVTDSTCANNASELHIGHDSGSGEGGSGLSIDEAAVYATALSSGRVSAHFAAATAVAGNTYTKVGYGAIG